MSFVHLHTHSHYSLLDGLSKSKDFVRKAQEYGMPAVGLTDHGTMYGIIDFYDTLTQAGLKPIIGVEAYMAKRSLHDKEPHIDSKRYHLTLLAENNTGYENLIKLTTIAHLEGFYYKPRIDKQVLKQHAEGLICLSGCPGGELAEALMVNNLDQGRKIVMEFLDIFGPNHYFLEVMNHPEVENIKNIHQGLKTLAKEFNLPLVATYDSHYPEKEDAEAHHTLVAINTGAEVADQGLNMKNGDYSFIGPEEAKKLYQDFPEAVANTVKIAERCNVSITLGEFIFPTFGLPRNTTADEELKHLCLLGMKKRGLTNKPEAIKRLDYELDIIKMKGYADYFLVVGDLIRFARENNIYYNIRGSVAGSMTTYSLEITKLDPIEYQIPFERFLNPERPSAPDIDMDFADNRRDEIIEYAKEKYGSDKVAQIGTFGTMMARGSVRDVARALSYPYSVGDRLAKLIPLGSQGSAMTIDRALKTVPELKEAYQNETDTKKILDLAKKIEGSARHISVHAAGVVIAPEPLNRYVPMQYDPKGQSIITQYDMYAVGEDGVGLTKFDFLGLRNLSILANAVRLVKKIYNQNIDIENIPLDNKKTFSLLARGETEGLFQLNGAGMTRWLKELKPTNIDDINAMVALYRPGPMEFIPEYIKRKHNPQLVDYPHPALQEDLERSYGLLIYQEDVMMTAIKLAGYSWLEADKFRKAMGKKIPKLMAEQEKKFKDGCIKNGIDKNKAVDLWNRIKPFAAYAFNKAHSASYGRVAYETAYMKANYPVVYMCACLTAESGDIEQIGVYVGEAKRMGIDILPPAVNESFGDFTVVDNPLKENEKAIRFGLYTIKNLGYDIADHIVEIRKKDGPFQSYSNFLDRITHKNLNRKSLEALIKAGALDSFGHDRGHLLHNLEEAVSYNRTQSKNTNSQQSSLFDLMTDTSSVPIFKLKTGSETESEQLLLWEKELLGLYISGHPLNKFKDKFSKKQNTIAHNRQLNNGAIVQIAGIIENVKVITTRRGGYMAFIRLADFSDKMEIVVFSESWDNYKNLLIVDQCVVIKGKISHRQGDISLLLEKAKKLE
ncbi:MAG: DNA polymerase III subunit alpha [Patescibacteria group bacterium]